jgi:hypothetical protein
MNRRSKTGPARVYSAAEIERFAQYREHRAPLTPCECNRGAVCWVAAGPPAIGPGCHCLGCGGAPGPFSQRHATRRSSRPRKYPSHF